MHAIIAGCGRVGATLADRFDAEGHEVVIIDRRPGAFSRLGPDFGGTALKGIVFDRETLEEAGIARADAFIAVTSGDNSNIVSARAARDHFKVPRVVARIYDPARALIFERLGITTIATTTWTAEEIVRALRPPGAHIEGCLGTGPSDVVWLALAVPDGVHGVPATALARPGEVVVAAVSRDGRASVVASGALIEGGDVVHVAAARGAVEATKAAVAALGGEQA